MFIAFFVATAVAAFIPCDAAPGIVSGVKAINSRLAVVSFDSSSPAPTANNDTANQDVFNSHDSERSV